jgi:hypothetical protein
MIKGKLNFEELRTDYWSTGPITLNRIDDIGLVCLWQTSRCLNEAKTRYEAQARNLRERHGSRYHAVDFTSVLKRVRKLIKAGVDLKPVTDMRRANKSLAVHELNEFAKSLVFSA